MKGASGPQKDIDLRDSQQLGAHDQRLWHLEVGSNAQVRPHDSLCGVVNRVTPTYRPNATLEARRGLRLRRSGIAWASELAIEQRVSTAE